MGEFWKTLICSFSHLREKEYRDGSMEASRAAVACEIAPGAGTCTLQNCKLMDAMLLRRLAMLCLELRTCQKVLTDGLVRSMQRIVLSKWV